MVCAPCFRGGGVQVRAYQAGRTNRRTMFEFSGRRRAAFRFRGADLGCVAACRRNNALARRCGGFFSPNWLLPNWPLVDARRCATAVSRAGCGALGCETVSSACTPTAASRKCFFGCRFIKNTESSCQNRFLRNGRCAQHRNVGEVPTLQRHSTPRPQPLRSNRTCAGSTARQTKIAQASAPPTTKGRAGPTRTNAAPAAGVQQNSAPLTAQTFGRGRLVKRRAGMAR